MITNINHCRCAQRSNCTERNAYSLAPAVCHYRYRKHFSGTLTPSRKNTLNNIALIAFPRARTEKKGKIEANPETFEINNHKRASASDTVRATAYIFKAGAPRYKSPNERSSARDHARREKGAAQSQAPEYGIWYRERKDSTASTHFFTKSRGTPFRKVP